MANMQRLRSETEGANARFIEHMGARARNVINEQYGQNIDEMFERLHKQTDGQYYTGKAQEEHLSEIGGGYTRIGFDTKAQRDAFVSDMANQGIEAVYAPKKFGSQWLVEIPNSIETDKLNEDGEVARSVENSGFARVSSSLIIESFEKRTGIEASDPTPVQNEEETPYSSIHLGFASKAFQHAEVLGGVIGRARGVASDLEGHGNFDDKHIFTEGGNTNASKVKQATVINGETVLIDGKVVTDKKTVDSILKRHEKRMHKAERHAKPADFIIKKEDKLNGFLADRADEKNKKVRKRNGFAQSFDRKHHPVFVSFHEGLGREVYETDLYNPEAKEELGNLLADGGYDLDPVKTVRDKNGDTFAAVYRNSETGKKVTVVHKHAKGAEFHAPLTAVAKNSQAIKRAAYKQNYAVLGDYVVGQSIKDISLSDESADVLTKFYERRSGKLNEAQILALNNLYSGNIINNLNYEDRRSLEKMLRKEISTIKSDMSDGISDYTKAELKALEEAADEIKLSKYEEAEERKTDSDGNIVESAVKIDFGLGAIKAVAATLNADFLVSQAEMGDAFTLADSKGVALADHINFTDAEGYTVNLFTEIQSRGYRLDFSNEEYAAIEKILNNPNASLTATERFHLTNAAEKYHRKYGEELSAEGIEHLEGAIEALKLGKDESKSVEKILGIQKDLGIPISSANFTPDKILEMNKALLAKTNAAGINLFERKGGKWVVSTEKLEMLNPEMLKSIGISETTRQTMIDINKAQINPSGGTFSSLSGAAANGIISMMCKVDEDGDTAKLIDAGRKTKSAYQYTKAGIVNMRRAEEARKVKRDAKRAAKSGYGKQKTKPQKKKKPKKKKEKAEKLLYNANPEKLEKMTAKAAKAQEKDIKKALKRERSMYGRFNTAKAKVAQKLSQTMLGKLVIGAKELVSKAIIAPAAAAFGVIMCIEAVIIIIIIILMTISAFLDSINPINWINNALAPETYADTVAYTLYDDYLRVKEEDWVDDDLCGFKKMYDNRVDMNYGADYQDFQTYFSQFDDIVLKDNDGNGYYSDVYINPFSASGVSHDKIISEGYNSHEEYDGTQTVTLGCNNNAFSKTSGSTEVSDIQLLDNGLSTVESGHTCNIKDILCMTDVMYGMDLSKMGEADFENDTSIMGKSPEQVSFEDGVENVVGFFKWLWNTIQSVNPFSDAKFEPLANFCNDKVGMKTIIKYAETLYESSHQQQVALDVQYLKYEPLVLQTTNGTREVNDDIAQKSASALGYCVSPVEKEFYLKWNSGTDGHGARVSPYFTANEDGTGDQYITDLPTDESGYKVQVDMSNYSGYEDPCLKYDMGSKVETYDFIKKLADHEMNDMGAITLCWKQTKNAEVQEPKTMAMDSGCTGGSTYYTRSGGNSEYSSKSAAESAVSFTEHSGSGGWYDSESAAKDAVKNSLKDKYDNAVIPDDSYVLSSDRNKFTKTFYEQPAFEVEYGETTTHDFITGWHTESWERKWYWSEASGTGISTSGTHGEDWCVRKWNSEFEAATDGDGQPVWYATGFRSQEDAKAWVNSHEISTGWYSICCKFDVRWKVVNDYSTFYHSSGKCVTVEKKVDEFERECKGHDFKYCGGHIGVHSHGVVYSITNEQIALSTVRDEKTGNPLADDFDLAEKGYETLKGKVIHNEVDYSTAETAASTGGCPSPLFDPQGSISGMYGLNLKVEGGQWVDGYKTRSSNSYHLMRDIFDIDTLILKGDNIFPLQLDYHNYEGWSEDNMTLVILKWAADWYEEYGFDIPQEIWWGELGEENEDDGTIEPYDDGYDGCGQAPLSQKDIDNIVNAVKDNYGETIFNDDREAAVRFALGYVGKGHYNQYHDHNYLAKACNGLNLHWRDFDGNESWVDYDGCCTTGSEESFTNFIRLHFGKSERTGRVNNASTQYPVPYTYDSSSGTSNAYPADVIAHLGTSNLLDIVVPEEYTWDDFYLSIMCPKLTEMAQFKTAFFVGISNEDIELSTGQVIEAGAPITIDLTALTCKPAVQFGNIYLHGQVSDSNDFFDLVSFEDQTWLTYDTSRTKLVRFN